MPKVKDLIFKYDNKLKDGVDIEKEKSKKKFKEILEKFKNGNIENTTNTQYEKPNIIHDEKFNKKLDFWKNKEKEVLDKEHVEPEKENINENIERKIKKDKKKKKKVKNTEKVIIDEKNNIKLNEVLAENKVKKSDDKIDKKQKKHKKDKPLKNNDSEENLEDEF
jgi:hypothetical protein